MIADIWGVMAGATKSRNAFRLEHVIEAPDTGDVDFRRVENRLSARDRRTIYVNGGVRGKAAPSLVKVEDVRVERRACRIFSEGVVDADKETGKLSLQVDRAAGGPIRIEILGAVVKTLGCEDAAFEIDNFLLLRSGGSRIRLCVTECCVHRLTGQVGLTSIPHDCAQEIQIGRGKWAAVN